VPSIPCPPDLLISQFEIGDWPDYRDLLLDPRTRQYDQTLSRDPAGSFIESLTTPWFSPVGWNEYAVRDRLSRNLVGLVSHRRAGSETLVGYHVSPHHWGCGYGTAAVRGLVSSLEARGWPPPVLMIDQANLASARVAEKLGFRIVAIDPSGQATWGK
jgi:RimJ/RimL family protein N-acetyltransferase